MMKKNNEKSEKFTKTENRTFVNPVGENIREFRTAKALSQKALGDAIGVSQKAIDFWERGVNEPKATYILRLAEFFDVSCDVLLGRKQY